MTARKLLVHSCPHPSPAIISSTDHVLAIIDVLTRAFARVFFHYGGGPSKLAGKICLDPGKSGIIVVATHPLTGSHLRSDEHRGRVGKYFVPEEPTPWGFFTGKRSPDILPLIYAKIRKSRCENRVNLEDLQNTFDWS